MSEVPVRWAATKEGVENFVSLVVNLQYGVLANCPACDEVVRVVPLEDGAKRAAYECACGASWAKRSKYVYRLAD